MHEGPAHAAAIVDSRVAGAVAETVVHAAEVTSAARNLHKNSLVFAALRV
jgi:hypothetical protein